MLENSKKYSIKNYQKLPDLYNCTICVIGLGYVGLPLAIEFSKIKKCLLTSKVLKRKIIGFDLNKKRVKELQSGIDVTREIEDEDKKDLQSIKFISDSNETILADVFIISVPTPIDSYKKPDLSFLKSATKLAATFLKKRSDKNSSPIFIFESTVYPGTTEDICVPIIEENTGLSLNKHFFCGYSPERINPGDKKHRLSSIVKVTSGSNEETASWVNRLYGSIIKAGTYKAKSIKVAEAAKIIENTQRDLNIALVNELAKICKLLNLDTLDVLDAAGSKWNFLPFKPGLVGGHCISVDPYYLTFIAQKHGYKTEVVLAGRKLNDEMSEWIFEQIVIASKEKNIEIYDSRVLVLGLTFKENCPDIRNSKAFDLIRILNNKNIFPDIYDPYICDEKKIKDLKFRLLKESPLKQNYKYDVLIVLTAHNHFINIKKISWLKILKKNHIIYDLKGILPRSLNALRL